MQCNIDARGRAVRWRGGILCLILGAIALGAAFAGAPRVPSLAVAASLVLAGLFALYESRKGWCVVRAMGFKTSV